MSLLAAVVGQLSCRGTPHAVIGATALAVHGVSRSTLDLDVLTTDRLVMQSRYWTEVAAAGGEVEIRHGDVADPLVGVVRVTRGDERPVDVIVGEGSWQERLLAEATVHEVAGTDVPVVDRVGLVLLKLYAGGPQDLWDILQLVATEPETLISLVDQRLPDVPARCALSWDKVRRDLG